MRMVRQPGRQTSQARLRERRGVREVLPIAIGECSFCPSRFLGTEAGRDRRGRTQYKCGECRDQDDLGRAPERIGPRRVPATTAPVPRRQGHA